MEDLLPLKIIIKEITNTTEVACKLNLALLTAFLRLLDLITIETLNLCDFVPIHFVI